MEKAVRETFVVRVLLRPLFRITRYNTHVRVLRNAFSSVRQHRILTDDFHLFIFQDDFQVFLLASFQVFNEGLVYLWEEGREGNISSARLICCKLCQIQCVVGRPGAWEPILTTTSRGALKSLRVVRWDQIVSLMSVASRYASVT